MDRVSVVIILLCYVTVGAWAQQEMDCYGAGSIAGAVFGTLICTLLLLGIGYFIYKRIWKLRREKHLVLETDPEQGDKYAFDNPSFKDVSGGLTPIAKALDKSGTRLLETGGGKKWSHWSPLGALVSTKNEKKRTVDDTHVDSGETKVVSLRSHDFTGLGFNICGNMREGIYIKEVLHRGPASESGKLNSGDRINSVRISFEHMVYEDALTILSYASPYEVQIEAKGGFKGPHGPPGSQIGAQGKGAEPRHPLFRSSSSSDLVKIGKSARQRLFLQGDLLDTSLTTEYSTLQLSSNNTTLERGRISPKPDVNSLPKPERARKPPAPVKLTPEQLKTQLEANLAAKITHIPENDSKKIEEVKQTSEVVDSQINKNRFQKFGVRVLPMESSDLNPQQRSPKSAELSQNDNNINLERHLEKEGFDEVDKKEAPPVKKREKATKIVEVPKLKPLKTTDSSPIVNLSTPPMLDQFERKNSLNDSGIKRDKAGIPQEIPEHMLQAANAARKNRKSVEILEIEKNLPETLEVEDPDLVKTPNKKKGKAPAPPPVDTPKSRLNFTDNFDEISTLDEKDSDKSKLSEIKLENGLTESKSLDESKEYNSDSDLETDNQSSVNTIELNSSDITIHHAETDSEMKARKTASTGDLSKIQKGRKSNTGTLERAQSLDITDSGIPTLTKKRKATKVDLDSKLSSDESLYEQPALKTKEPRLSLALDGLDTFQRNRLKKSSEWGNLEDVILNLDKDPETPLEDIKLDFIESPIKYDFGAKDIKFGDSTILDEIHPDIVENKIAPENTVKNALWPKLDEATTVPVPKENDIDIFKPGLKVEIVKPVELSQPQLSGGLVDSVAKSGLKFEQVSPTQVVHNSSVFEPGLKVKPDFTKPMIVDKTEKIITEVKVNNIIWPEDQNNSHNSETSVNASKSQDTSGTESDQKIFINIHESKIAVQSLDNSSNLADSVDTSEKPVPFQKPNVSEAPFSLKAQFQEKLNSKLNQTDPSSSKVSHTSTTTFKPAENALSHPGKSSQNFIFAEKYASNNDPDPYNTKLYDTNVSDDIKVSRHSLGSLERPKSDVLKSVNKLKMQSLISSDQGGVSNVTITESKPETDTNDTYDMSTASELYTTAIDSTLTEEIAIQTSPIVVKNITITESNPELKYTTESPSSLTIDTSSDGPDSIKSNNLTFVTEIQVSTPPNGNTSSTNISEIEITQNNNSEVDISTQNELHQQKVVTKSPDMNFNISEIEITQNSDIDITSLHDSQAQTFEHETSKLPEMKFNISEIEITQNNNSEVEVITPRSFQPQRLEDKLNRLPEMKFNISEIEITQKDNSEVEQSNNLQLLQLGGLKKLPEMKFNISEVEITQNDQTQDESLKKLPEMKFTTSSYESPKTPEKRMSHIEMLRSNFEKSPPKSAKPDNSPSKSRIPIFKMSPETRKVDLDCEEKEIVEMLTSSTVHHSTPLVQASKLKTAGRNVTVTSIRTSSKIPSGHHMNFKPPVPARPGDTVEESPRNGSSEHSSFKQWVFNPSEASVTNIVVNNNKEHHK